MNNKRVEAEARTIFGKDVFLKKEGFESKEDNGSYFGRKRRPKYGWGVWVRVRPDHYSVRDSDDRGNRKIGSGGSPKEALEDAIDRDKE